MRVDPRTRHVLAALALLYTAQGIPFGLAAEYLPVVLRELGYSRTFIASLFWLQLPWQLKALWAPLGDHPRVRPHARPILLALQCALALTTASYALFPITTGLRYWFVITFVSALFASTQDIFVDAFAVRSLDANGRGYGNTAQVAGYRVGIVLGGVALLHYQTRWGATPTLLACAAVILLAGLGAFALRADAPAAQAPVAAPRPRPPLVVLLEQLRAVVRRDVWRVAALAVTYKLGAHAAASLIKPMLVDHGWSREAIKDAVVLYGTGASIVGALLGGALHRALREPRALGLAAAVQAASMLPLALVALEGAASPRGLTISAIVAEHLASGLGTTVLFAALMSATHRERAALHYTVLTSLNAVAIALGGYAGSLTADGFGLPWAVGLAAALCLAPCALLSGWSAHAARSADADADAAEVEDSLTVRGGSL